MMVQHEEQLKSLTTQNQTLKTQNHALTQKQKADNQAMKALQQILHERQTEYSGLRKQYALVESAIHGTAYVAEIQERITKMNVEEDYSQSVSKDLELVKQIDSLKSDFNKDQNKLKILERENEELKRDLNKAIQSFS